jgi:hypothetical protein
MRTDLLVFWPYPEGLQKVVIELKVLHKSLEATLAQGLNQTVEYLDRSGAEEAHLVIFDRDHNKLWEEKIFTRVEEHRGRVIRVWGM